MTVLSFDLETELISRETPAPMPVAAAWSFDGAPPSIGLWADFKPILEAALADPSVTEFVNQTIAFDFTCAATGGVDPEVIFAAYAAGRVRSIDLCEKLIRYAARGDADEYNLAELCAFYNLPTVDKGDYWRTHFALLRNVPVADWPAGAREYLLADADRPAKIYACQLALDKAWERAKGSRILHLAGEEAYKAFALKLVACKGLYTRPAESLELRRVLIEALDKSRDVLIEAGLVRDDGSKNEKAARAYVVAACEQHGLRVQMTKRSKKHPKGQVALGKDVLELIPDDLLTAYSIYSQASTYRARVDDLCQGFELPLQVRYNTMLETRRTSTSKPKLPQVGVQAQNFPQRLLIGRGEKTAKHPRGTPVYAPVGARECLRPSAPDRVYIAADLPTAELRSVSQECYERFGYSKLGDAINNGKDVHRMLGGTLINLTYEEMERRAEETDIKIARDNAKAPNFSLWGGVGNASLRQIAWRNYRLQVDEATAEEWIRAWRLSWPEHKDYFAAANADVSNGGLRRWQDKVTGEWQEMKTCTFRHPSSGFWRANLGYTQRCNTPFQERTGAAASRALMEVQRRCFTVRSSALYGCWGVMYTHDEIVADAPREQAHEAALELGEVCKDKFNELHPLVPITKIDAIVADVYSKAMKPVRDAATGRLVPWRPSVAKAA